ncbi:MAG TPA: A24 family peptidase [Alphaproteobacteria bacterium]|nr:prepilin peptidase [Alphaproteobacteria bacterium]USO04869.1 MAG: prepilin peptidase [Rhodospirillales bacterium]HOO81867.1 A24 family peptidase [Alphaproteobacteria bacterium]
MLEIVSILCLLIGTGLLAALIIIDLRTLLLPNILVLSLALAGFMFHASTLFFYMPVSDMVLGGFIGGGTLYLIRALGNAFYKTDTLGLGDVKLMAVGGLWLGSYFILIALMAGAVAGLVHGLMLIVRQWIKTRRIESLSTFSLPAGPGFAAGLFIAALEKFFPLTHLGLS